MTLLATPLDRGPWWDDLCRAEWACIVHELALGCVEHHERCPDCSAGRFPCDNIRRGFEAGFDWLHARNLRAKVEHVRESALGKAA